MNSSTQELQWVLRAQCRDREALELLLRAVQPSVRRYFAGLVGAVSSEELTRELLPALASISPASRAVIMLHYQEELPLRDAAAILGIPIGTAKSRLAYGLKSLRKLVKSSGDPRG